MAYSNNPHTLVSADLDSLMSELNILEQQSPTDQQGARTSNEECQDITISTGRVLSGTLPHEILRQRIDEARKIFTKTKTFKHVSRLLEKSGHVTICGASGEGKTTMALMLAREYMKKGYEAVFVEDVDAFNVNEILCSINRLVLIVDDIFGSVGLTTDNSHLKNLVNSLKCRIQHLNQQSIKFRTTQDRHTDTQQPTKESQGKQDKKDIRVVFTSKTYNFKDGISNMQYQRFSMFTGYTTIDLTADKEHRYSDDERIAMFEKHNSNHPHVKADDISKQDLLDLDTELFGFPLTCRLFFEFTTFSGCAKEFFSRPLFYLKLELNNILSLNNTQTAALILMLLCHDNLHLDNLGVPGRDQTMEEIIKHVADLLPSATRQGIITAVKNFKGTFFSGGDVLSFAHPSIYDACACAWYNFNPGFVLQYCSLDFLYERLKAGSEESIATDSFNFLLVSDSFHDLVATRLTEEVRQGQFAKTVTHPLLKNEHFVEVLLAKLQSASAIAEDNSWVRQKDRQKGILYWAVQGHSTKLVHQIENLLNIKLTRSEITEALEGCVETDKLPLLKFLSTKLEKRNDFSVLNRFLLMSGETGSWEMTEYLLKEGADINTLDTNKQNYIHIVCRSERPNILKSFICHIGSLVTQSDYLSAIKSVDVDGWTPAMLAAMFGSWDCFTLISSDSDLDTQDADGNSSIHSAAWHGNKDIVQHILTPSNINSKGQYGWTPVMFAADSGQQRVFTYLVSNNADLTLVDVGGNSLLHLACQGGNMDIVQHVLTPSNINSRGLHEWTPVMKAAVSGQQRVFTYLVSKNADLTLVDVYGDNILHLASQGGNTDIVQHVLTPSNINSRGRHGWTPVMYAAVKGQQSVFTYLVSNNADLTLVDIGGSSLLHLACRGGNMDIVQHVLTPSNINSRGLHEWTPVMKAAVNGQQRVFTYLVSKNADLTLVDVYGDNILHLACRGGNMDIVQHVLTPSNINSRGHHGSTPVMKAAFSGQQRVFTYLVSKNADLTVVEFDGDNILHLACLGGNMDIVQHVLTPSNINTRGRHGWTPVMNAAVEGQQRVFTYLVSNNADLTLVDVNGDNILHLACQGGNMDIVQHALTPSNINSKGAHEWTPVMKAAFSGQQRVFTYLVSKNADLTLVDVYGDNILHLACRGGNMDIVQHVLTPSNINSRGRYEQTPVMNAAFSGQQRVFTYLVSNNADLTLVDVDGDNILHLACHGGNMDIVQHVLTPSNINSKGEHEWTPVMKAAASGQQRVFTYLVSNNADLTLVDVGGNSLLHLACQGGNMDIVQHVLTPSNINSRGLREWTPVMKAAVSGQQRLFTYLVSNNADLTLVDVVGDNMLHLACRGGNMDIVQHVLTPSNINSRGNYGCTPVMIAAYFGNRRIINLLVENQADLTLVDDFCRDVARIALVGGKPDVAEYLRSDLNENMSLG